MHKDFSEWFRTAGIEQNNESLKMRWTGIDAFEVGRNDIVWLTELFFGIDSPKEKFLAAFRKAFQDADSSFRMRENDRELSVLAGATLVSVMERSPLALGDLAALAIVSCAAQNLRAGPCVVDIPELAVQHLNHRSVARGEIDAAEDSDATEDQASIHQLRQDFEVIAEESNILWWVFGETSRDTDQRWSRYSVAQTAIMAGKELAELTRIAPGPASAAALLDRVVKFAKSPLPTQIAVKDAIAAVDLEWRQRFAKYHCPTPLANIRPVSQGIKLSVELADGSAWVGALASSTKMRRDAKIAPRLLAYQVYVECLLSTFWNEEK